MNSTSLEEACHHMANALGLDPVRDRDEVVSFVNKYRNLLYNSASRVELFDDYEQCFALTTFRQKCSGNSCPTYRGFTATLDMAGVVGAWESLEPLTVRSRWREVHRGKGAGRGGAVEIIPVTGTFATERDMTGTYQLQLYAHSEADAGKSVHIQATSESGDQHHLHFTLGKDQMVTVNRAVCSVDSVTLPADLCARVDLFQADGTRLSTYPPGVTVPQYRRYKVPDKFVCDSNTILVQSARNFIPVTEDHEVVEIGDQLVIQNAGRYFKYGESTLDKNERAAAKDYLAEMYFHIDGGKARDRSREQNDGALWTTGKRSTRRRGLPGYQKKRRSRY